MKPKPCPFCGREVVFTRPANPSPPISYVPFQVQCDGCGVRGPVFYQHRHLAVQGWNALCRKD